MTATFPYGILNYPDQGVCGGFDYKTVPHITLSSIAQNEPLEQETLYDQPEIDRSKAPVSGPLTGEVIPVAEAEDVGARHGVPLPAGLREAEGTTAVIDRRYREGRVANPAADHITTMIELLPKAGVNFPGGKKLLLENLRPLGVGWLHAEAEAADSVGASGARPSEAERRSALRTPAPAGHHVRLLAVGIYDPNTGELHQSRGEDVAAWSAHPHFVPLARLSRHPQGAFLTDEDRTPILFVKRTAAFMRLPVAIALGGT
jgi:hypothetical protein